MANKETAGAANTTNEVGYALPSEGAVLGGWPALVVTEDDASLFGQCTDLGFGDLALQLPASVVVGESVYVTLFFEDDSAGFGVAEVTRAPDARGLGVARLRHVSQALLRALLLRGSNDCVAPFLVSPY